MEEIICDGCGEKFKKYPSQIYNKNYCSQNCRRKRVEVECKVCGKKEKVIPAREKTYYTCSKKCSAKRRSRLQSEKVTVTCLNCNNTYKIKKSRTNRSTYCSKTCQAEHYKNRYKLENNPNWKNIETDYDGYIIKTTKDGIRMPLHKAVTLEVLNIKETPNGFHIHHRDCDITNNTPNNLVILSISDHKWLHKNFGNATLWAYMNDKIDLDTICSWCRDEKRARKLLPISLYNQIGVFKSGEFSESPEVDNTEPSGS